MTRPDESGEDPHQPDAGSDGALARGERPEDPPESAEPAGGRAVGGHPPDDPAGSPWDWAVDPAPPEGPSQQPMPDPAAGRAVDEIPEPIPPGVGAPPGATGTPTGPGSEPHPADPEPEPPAWSTPDTPASTPPLSGNPSPQSWPGPSGPPTGPQESTARTAPGAPGPPGRPVPEFVRPTDRRWWFVLGIVAALLSCCCVAAGVIALAWGPALYSGLPERGQRVVGLNQPARDGDLEFRVSRLRCGLTEVGDPLVSQYAAGQFCLVDLVIRNLGARPVVFHDNLQIAYGPAGQRFGVNSSAGLLANADQQAFLGEINPGNRVTGAIVYDIPPDSRIVRLRLHGSATSPGVQVRTG